MKLIEKVKQYFASKNVNLLPIFQTVGILVIAVSFVFAMIAFYQVKTIGTNQYTEKYHPLVVQSCMYTLKYNSVKLELINEVDKYIKSAAPQSSLEGYVIVEECIDNAIDICFVLSQGEQESHFGTAGLARRTNSVFNVFAFDGKSHDEISEQGKYKHPNYSVRPYIQLLKNDYLVNGKTEYDLMEDGQYVNKNGARYASAETYEKSLLNKFTKIRQTTKIDSLYQEANKYRLFLGL